MQVCSEILLLPALVNSRTGQSIAGSRSERRDKVFSWHCSAPGHSLDHSGSSRSSALHYSSLLKQIRHSFRAAEGSAKCWSRRGDAPPGADGKLVSFRELRSGGAVCRDVCSVPRLPAGKAQTRRRCGSRSACSTRQDLTSDGVQECSVGETLCPEPVFLGAWQRHGRRRRGSNMEQVGPSGFCYKTVRSTAKLRWILPGTSKPWLRVPDRRCWLSWICQATQAFLHRTKIYEVPRSLAECKGGNSVCGAGFPGAHFRHFALRAATV